MIDPIKTGEVFDRDEDGQLWLCESWLDEETGVTHTTRTLIEQNIGNGEE
jgi:hypothetical protein